jgi:hypothetical protein
MGQTKAVAVLKHSPEILPRLVVLGPKIWYTNIRILSLVTLYYI